jgi:hypothetical protein
MIEAQRRGDDVITDLRRRRAGAEERRRLTALLTDRTSPAAPPRMGMAPPGVASKADMRGLIAAHHQNGERQWHTK